MNLAMSGMNIFLALAPSSKAAHIKRFSAFVLICGEVTEDDFISEDDINTHADTLHEDGYKTSTLWTALSTINPFFNIRLGAELKSIH
jgi:hypothetical protein